MRYLIMAGADYYASGVDDIRGRCETEEAAREHGEALLKQADWVSLVDLKDWAVLGWWRGQSKERHDNAMWKPLPDFAPPG